MTGPAISQSIHSTKYQKSVHAQSDIPEYHTASGVPFAGSLDVGHPRSLLSLNEDQQGDAGGDWQGDCEKPLGCNFPASGTCGGGEPKWHKQVFSPRQAEMHLEQLNLRALPFDEDTAATANPKEKLQISLWRSMATDMAGGCRQLISGTDERIKAVELIAEAAPNFGNLCDIFAQALGASMRTQTPLKVPPILLLGKPGVGKTHASAAIANALDTDVVALSMTTTTSVNPLAGTDMVWRNRLASGMVAKALIEGRTASPIFILDELDKAFCVADEADPLAPLHTYLEAETARNSRDEFLELPFAADGILWIATANSLDGLAPSIVDRMLVLEIVSTRRERKCAW